MRTRTIQMLVRAIPLVVFGVGVGAVPAEAKQTPAFSSVTAVAGDQHDVTMSFTETALAPQQSVTERLRAKATDAYACYTTTTGERAGSDALVEHPSNEQQFQANSEGSIDAAALATSVQPIDVCRAGETSYLYKTVFTHLRLTDLTNRLSAGLPGTFTSCSPPDCEPPAHL